MLLISFQVWILYSDTVRTRNEFSSALQARKNILKIIFLSKTLFLELTLSKTLISIFQTIGKCFRYSLKYIKIKVFDKIRRGKTVRKCYSSKISPSGTNITLQLNLPGHHFARLSSKKAQIARYK